MRLARLSLGWEEVDLKWNLQRSGWGEKRIIQGVYLHICKAIHLAAREFLLNHYIKV